MDLQRRGLQIGAAVIACAVVLRLLGSGVPEKLMSFFGDQRVLSALVFLETGRVVRPAEYLGQPEQTTPPPREATAPETTPQETQPEEPPAQAVFAEGDAALVEVNSVCGYDADLPALLQQPLEWDLTQQGPTVLIVHTHGTESYTKTEDYTESSDYRTLDDGYNVVSVGDRLEQLLEEGGVEVIHDRTMHDYPSYSASYNEARASIQAYLKEYPTIRLVLDVHRDSVADSSGRQMRFTVRNGEESVAQLMLVVGTDASGLSHPHWPENMSLAVKLHAQLEKDLPGICRPISFRTQRFNQDLSPGALIVEVGSAGNTRQEALLAVEELAKAVLELSLGTA